MQRRYVLALIGGCSMLAGCSSEQRSSRSSTPATQSSPSDTESEDRVLHVKRVFPEDISNVILGMLHRPTADAVAKAAETNSAELPSIYQEEGPAVATADAIEIDSEWYNPKYKSGGGWQGNYRLKFRPPAELDENPPGEEDEVIDFETLPDDQQAIAEEAIADEYYVGWEEQRSEAFKKVSDIDYLEYNGEVYAKRLVHGDKIIPPELEFQPITPEHADLQFILERATLESDATEWAEEELGPKYTTSASESFPISAVPEGVLTVAREYDYCSFGTNLYRFSIRDK